MTHTGSRNSHGPHTTHGRWRRQGRLLAVLVALGLLAGGGYAVFSLLGGDAQDDEQVTSARKPLAAFLAGWAGHDARKAARYTDTPDSAASLLTSVLTNLKPSKTTIDAAGGRKKDDGEVDFPFTVSMTVPGSRRPHLALPGAGGRHVGQLEGRLHLSDGPPGADVRADPRPQEHRQPGAGAGRRG